MTKARASDERGEVCPDLRHVLPDEEPGLCRRRCGRGFTYLTATGQTLRDPRERRRIEAMAIPPAWQSVWICSDRRGHIQAVGVDEAGRRQYIYHERWSDWRHQRLFERQGEFSGVLPLIRRRAARDASRSDLGRQRVLGTIVRLLDQTLVRVGSERYRKRHGSFGLTTLRLRHIEDHDGELHLHFRGKGGIEREVAVTDAVAQRALQDLMDVRGRRVFSYGEAEDAGTPLHPEDVNEYLREIAQIPCTAKDFRTWGGSVSVASMLMHEEPASSETARHRQFIAAVKHAAERLGNTPAICRQHYVHPHLEGWFADRSLHAAAARVRTSRRPWGFDHGERTLDRLLESH